MSGEVLLVHGMWSTPRVWDGFAAGLRERGWRTHAPRLPEHSADADLERLGRLGIADYVAALEAAVDQIDRAPLVVGHSLGGLLSMLLANRRPVRGLALLAPACPAGVFAISPSALRSLSGPLTRWAWWRKPFKLSREKARWALMGELEAERQEPLLDELVHESGRALFEVGFWLLKPGGPTVLRPLDAPARVWVGLRDRICPPGPIKRLAARLDAPLTLLEGRSHWLQEERGRDELIEDIDAWARELPEPDRG